MSTIGGTGEQMRPLTLEEIDETIKSHDSFQVTVCADTGRVKFHTDITGWHTVKRHGPMSDTRVSHEIANIIMDYECGDMQRLNPTRKASTHELENFARQMGMSAGALRDAKLEEIFLHMDREQKRRRGIG